MEPRVTVLAGIPLSIVVAFLASVPSSALMFREHHFQACPISGYYANRIIVAVEPVENRLACANRCLKTKRCASFTMRIAYGSGKCY